MVAIKEMVDFMVKDGTKNTSCGSWIFYTWELADLFDCGEDLILSYKWEIMEELNSRSEIAEASLFEDGAFIGGTCFDIVFWLDYCPNAE